MFYSVNKIIINKYFITLIASCHPPTINIVLLDYCGACGDLQGGVETLQLSLSLPLLSGHQPGRGGGGGGGRGGGGGGDKVMVVVVLIDIVWER